jgi:hypothetical protein
MNDQLTIKEQINDLLRRLAVLEKQNNENMKKLNLILDKSE